MRLIFAFVLLVPATALAGPASQPVQTVSFEGETLNGTISNPDIDICTVRSPSRRLSLIRLRENFRAQVLLSIGK